MFSIRNHIWAKIQDRKTFILSMIESFSCMKRAYENEVLADILRPETFDDLLNIREKYKEVHAEIGVNNG